ncbi:MAG: magnesium chelatase subunit H [Thermodesulfobacteriota bacterium]
MRRPLFVFIINAALTESLASGSALFRERHGPILDVRIFATHDIEEETVSARTVAESLEAADMVFLDIRGGGKALGVCHRVLDGTDQPVALLLGGSPDLMSLLRLGSFSMAPILERSRKKQKSGPTGAPNFRSIQRITALIEKGGSLLPVGKLKHARNWVRMMRYWQHGGPENAANLLAFAGRAYGGLSLSKPEKPREYPEYGLYDPLTDRSCDSLFEYRKAAGHDLQAPTVGLLFYGGMHFAQSLAPARAFAERLKAAGINVTPVYSTADRNLDAIRDFFFDNGKPAVDAVAYFQWFQLTTFSDAAPDASVQLLKELGVPVFCGCPMFGREVAKWRECPQGLSPVEALTTVILPELDGMIEPIPTAGLTAMDSDAVVGRAARVVAIPDRVYRACNRIQNWTRLQRKPDAEKRIAFIVYDNPPGEDNLGNAAYLDTFASLKRLFGEMARRGFTVADLPEEGLHEALLSRRFVNNARWGGEETAVRQGPALAVSDYAALLKELSPGDEIAPVWGPPPGEVMTADGRFILPAMTFGNLLLGIQPARGFHADPDKIAHDKTLPPHHQYAAFYRWLERRWKPDCVVHVGTHGTLEFLKGKEMGMSGRCFPEALIGDVPHLYFYHVVNASEATIAKRRSLGVLINYNSPSFAAGGLYDDYESLDGLIGEYLEALTLEPSRAERLGRQVLERAADLHLGADSVAAVQEEISLMKRSIIPKGLHILGEDIAEADRIAFAEFFLRYDRGEVPSLHRLLAEERGYDYEALLCPTRADDPAAGAGALEAIETDVASIVAAAWTSARLPESEPHRTAVSNALRAARALDGGLEWENFFTGLSGGYIEPGLGGDPLRNPDALPTGRNSFQFDPRLVPSDEACRRGREIAENTLAHYRELHGDWPDSTAVILWGFETTKTRGETVGQVLAYLGVRIIPGSNPYHKKLEPIPLAELGRPRVDCLVQICGFFRDMYPNVLDLIDRAFSLVSDLDEPPEANPVRKHTLRLTEELAGTVPDDQLRRIAAGRIYGPRAGEYGTRTTHLIETGAWTSEAEIADLFTSTMSHLYSGTIHGERQPAAYRARLGRVELVSQVRDTHEYEIMDLDHYYEYFGGLARTVESVRGAPPAMLITDTTKEVIRTETVGASLNRGIRTRLLNPKWIDALLEHDYHGAQKIGDRVEYLIGFAATTHAVENWVWSAVTDRYIRDKAMFDRLSENNRFAAEEIIKRLLEAEGRGYWQATDEEKTLLRDRYLDLEGDIEERIEP